MKIPHAVVVLAVAICLCLTIYITIPSDMSSESSPYSIEAMIAMRQPSKEYITNQQFEQYKKEFKDDFEKGISNKFTAMMALFGIAVTAWVGLNIYNSTDKYRFEQLEKRVEEAEEAMEKMNELIDKTIELTNLSIKLGELLNKQDNSLNGDS